ncbi:MAG: alpha/beta hydrolase [Isosphaeraceae bacterium]
MIILLKILLGLVATALALPVVVVLTFLVYAVIRYGPVIGRIFEVRPVFLPLRVSPAETGETVRFTTEDGLKLEGSYLRRRRDDRVGILVFCHEYLSDRWSCLPYLDHLRDEGYDIFTFDFRNHGASESSSTYSPLQWATEYEVRDLRAALGYLRGRDDHDPAGFGLFGVSRGGSTALVVSSEERDVWGVVTDGAFPTRGTMTAYILRWAEIYVRSPRFLALMPRWVYTFLGRVSRRRSERRLNCRFPDIETAVRGISPRPWLMVHGERDAYIGPEIARALFAEGGEPKEFWLVEDAKHNRCRECQPEAYSIRVVDFFQRYAPRRPLEPAAKPTEAPELSTFANQRALTLATPRLVPDVTAPVTS